MVNGRPGAAGHFAHKLAPIWKVASEFEPEVVLDRPQRLEVPNVRENQAKHQHVEDLAFIWQ